MTIGFVIPLISLTALTASALTAPAFAGGPSRPGGGAATIVASADPRTIIVEAPTRGQWADRLSRDLSRSMAYMPRWTSEVAPEGVVGVRFECSESGAPAKIALVRNSGDVRLDRMALRAVRRLKTMHPLPAAFGHDQRYMAMLVYANSEGEAARLTKRALTETAMLRRNGGDRMLALIASPVVAAP